MTDEAPYETIGFRAPASMRAAALAEAERLKLTPAEYGRMAYGRLLAEEPSLEDAEPWRSPPTKKEQRAAARAARATAPSTPPGDEPPRRNATARPPAPLARTEVQPLPKPTAGRRRR